MNLQYIKINKEMNIGVDLLYERLKAHSHTFHPVIDFDINKEKLMWLDLTENNKDLLDVDLVDTENFAQYVNSTLKKSKAKYAIGGYDEHRVLYKRSKLFASKGSEVSALGGDLEGAFRTIHLGIDIWGPQGTEVYAPLGGLIHSFAFNNNFGDYGATLILLHQLDTITFYTLYGHLSLDDIARVTEFQYVIRGQKIGHFGKPEENGYWPPHLHFQVIKNMYQYKGDYPGVCKKSERIKYLENSPDPDAILNLMRFAKS